MRDGHVPERWPWSPSSPPVARRFHPSSSGKDLRRDLVGDGGKRGVLKVVKPPSHGGSLKKWVFALGIARPSDHLTWSGLWWRINGVTDKVLMTYFASTSGRYGSRPAGLQAQPRQNGCILAGGWGASDRLISAQFCPQASKQYPSAPARW